MSKHLWPVEGAFIPGVAAVEQDVDDDTAAELLAFQPPAFSLTPPAIFESAAEPAALEGE
jgi:hypothetical protein